MFYGTKHQLTTAASITLLVLSNTLILVLAILVVTGPTLSTLERTTVEIISLCNCRHFILRD